MRPKILIKAIEEMSELQKELCKILNGERRKRRAELEYRDTMYWLDRLKKEMKWK